MDDLVRYFISVGLSPETAMQLAKQVLTEHKGTPGMGLDSRASAPVVAPDIAASGTAPAPVRPSLRMVLTSPMAQSSYDLKESKDPYAKMEAEYLRERHPREYYEGLAARDKEASIKFNESLDKAGSKAPRRDVSKSTYDEMAKLYDASTPTKPGH
jgi:hypothetical protein